MRYPPHVTLSLLGVQEWDKLECWMGLVWMLSPPEVDEIPEDLKIAMTKLFRQRPGAARKLTEWIEERNKQWKGGVPASFQQTCEQAQKGTL